MRSVVCPALVTKESSRPRRESNRFVPPVRENESRQTAPDLVDCTQSWSHKSVDPSYLTAAVLTRRIRGSTLYKDCCDSKVWID